jgi:EmrB/QacA subfamily drug resistance transporter
MEPRRWVILSSVSIGTFMATLDGSIVNISLPMIQQAFGVSLPTVEWVVVAYLLVVGSALLPMGRLGEVLTFKRVYVAGFAVFTIASGLCGAAPGPEALIGFRVLQGVGAAMLQAMGPAIIARSFPAHERGRALGLNGVSVSIGLSVGPALGGLLTDFGSWRAIFFVNVPVGIIAIIWALRVLPQEEHGERRRFDIPGAIFSAAALFALLLALIDGESFGWTSPLVVGLLVSSVVLGALFVRTERSSPAPMMDLNLFRSRAFSAGLASVVFAFAGLFTATFLLPFLLERGAGYSPLQAGLLLTPVPITTAIVAPFAGAFTDRYGARLPASLGIAIMVASLLVLTQLPANFTIPDLVWRLVFMGIGQGLFMTPNTTAVLGSAPRHRVGTASGVLAQMRIDGQAIGIAVSGLVVAVQLPVHAAELAGRVGTDAAQGMAFGMAIHDAFAVAAIFCSIGVVTTLVRGFAPGTSPSAVPAEPRPGSGSARPR